MPVKCCVPGCNGNYDTQRKKVSVFRFPLEDDLRSKWLQNFPRREWSPSKWSAVCERHFETHLIKRRRENNSSRRRGRAVLVAGAVPTIFPSRHRYLHTLESSTSEIGESQSDSDSDQNYCLPPPFRVNVPEMQIKMENPEDSHSTDNPFTPYGSHLEGCSIKQELHADNIQWKEMEDDVDAGTSVIIKQEPPDEEDFDEESQPSPSSNALHSVEGQRQREISFKDSKKSDDKIQCKVEPLDEPIESLETCDKEKLPVAPAVTTRTTPFRLVSIQPHYKGQRPLLPKGQPGTLLAAPILSNQGTMLLMRVIATAKEPPPLVPLPHATTGMGSGNELGEEKQPMQCNRGPITRNFITPQGRWAEYIPDILDTVTVEWYSDERGFKAKFRARLHSVHDCQQWLQHFEQRSNTNWVLVTSRLESTRFLLSRNYACHLSKWKKSDSSGRSLDCKAVLSFRVKKRTQTNKYLDPYVADDLMGVVQVTFRHSHSLDVKAVGKWLRRRPWLREVFMGYFQEGLAPAAAMRHHEDVVLAAEGAEQLLNRSINPPSGWVYQQYRRWKRARTLCGLPVGGKPRATAAAAAEGDTETEEQEEVAVSPTAETVALQEDTPPAPATSKAAPATPKAAKAASLSEATPEPMTEASTADSVTEPESETES